MNSKILRFLLVILLSGLVGYTVGVNKIKFDWANYQPQIEISSKEPPLSLTHIDFSPMWAVMQKIETGYYQKTSIDSQKMLNGAISGLVASLDDPYTVYLPPQQNDDFKEVMAGKFEGIGAELGMKDKQIIVQSPLDNSPAVKAGLKPLDMILEVNGKNTAGWTLSQAVEQIRGPKGTSVSLLVLSENAKEPKSVSIIRDTIVIKSVISWVKPVKDIKKITMDSELKKSAEKKVAYIRLSQFGDSANQEWVSAINDISMEVQGDSTVKGIIVDFRNNPGGYLTQAVFIASEFIKNGTVVMEEDREGQQRKLNVSREGLLTDIPVIVLTNKGSASASEIVAGALRDHNRAKLVGETSFGKGTIQQAEDLGAGAGLHLTIAKWLTPKGIWVHGAGLKPDIEVKLKDTDDINPSSNIHDTQLERAVLELVK
jgi:carboxyl-terminal processing protease